jgi:hypothetical protein
MCNWILCRMRNVSDKSRKNIKTHISCTIIFLRKSCRLWERVEKYGTARRATGNNTVRRMRFACWINKATDTHSENIMLIAFPGQHQLRERISMRLHARCSLRISSTDAHVYWNGHTGVALEGFIMTLTPPLTGAFAQRQDWRVHIQGLQTIFTRRPRLV